MRRMILFSGSAALAASQAFAVPAAVVSGVVQTDALVFSSSQADPNPGNNTASVSTMIAGLLPDAIFANGFECALGYPGCPTSGKPGFYTDRAEFLANVQSGYYQEDFADLPVGLAGMLLSFSGNGFSYEVTLITTNPFNELLILPGIVTTESSADALRITFTGAPVTAIGGNFWGIDYEYDPTGSEIILELADGTIESYTSSSPDSFGGFVTVAPIEHITIEATKFPTYSAPAMDNVIVGER